MYELKEPSAPYNCEFDDKNHHQTIKPSNRNRIMAKKKQLSPKYQVWIDARKKYKLSHAHIQMARELGLNPKKLGKLANHKQEPWKAPLPVFIENIYFKNLGKQPPENARSIEQMVKDKKQRQLQRKKCKQEEIDITPHKYQGGNNEYKKI
jgi:hypothetical protein